jgi:hypothetical protein
MPPLPMARPFVTRTSKPVPPHLWVLQRIPGSTCKPIGDWQGQQLDQHDAAPICLLLASAKMPAGKILSVLGCGLGRDLGTANDCRVGNSVNSFAPKRHVGLKNRGIGANIYARTVIIDFYGNIWSAEADKYGRKGTFNNYDQFEANSFKKRAQSKPLFTWENDRQTRCYAY